MALLSLLRRGHNENGNHGLFAPSAVTALALSLIVCMGAALRLYYYLHEPMRGDESSTYTEFATRSTYEVLSWYAAPNNHMLHTFLVHVCTRLLGNAPWVIRLPALVAGLATIPAAYLMMRRLCPLDRPAALVATALVASSTALVSYSANGRGYSLVGLITILLVSIAARLGREARTRDWVAFTVLPPLGLFTIPTMIYPYGGILVYLMLRRVATRAPGPHVSKLALSVVFAAWLTVLLYTPTFANTGIGSVTSNRFVAPRPWADIVRELPDTLAATWLQWNQDIPRVLAFGFVAIWAAFLVRAALGKGGCIAPSAITLVLFLFTLAVVLMQRVVPFDRVWLFLLPLYWGAIATAFSALLAWFRGPARDATVSGAGLALGLCVTLSALVLNSKSICEESSRLTINSGDSIALRLRPLLRQGDGVAAQIPCESSLKYYFVAHEVPVEYLYDFRVRVAKRLFLVVNRPGHPASRQTPESVLAAHGIQPPRRLVPRLLDDFGKSAIYVIER